MKEEIILLYGDKWAGIGLESSQRFRGSWMYINTVTFWMMGWRKALRSWRWRRGRGYSSRIMIQNMSLRMVWRQWHSSTCLACPTPWHQPHWASLSAQKGLIQIPYTIRRCSWTKVELWNGIPAEICQKLVESMPRRIKAVIRAKEGHTDY